jgi:hypothetical protein
VRGVSGARDSAKTSFSFASALRMHQDASWLRNRRLTLSRGLYSDPIHKRTDTRKGRGPISKMWEEGLVEVKARILKG